MEVERFYASSRVIIVAGKGGVGKTTVTAALSVAAARSGLSVLIVEVEGKSGLAAAFGRPPLGYAEVELEPGIVARTLTPDDALVEYLEDHGMRRVSKRLASSGALDVVATAVPGMKDILVLGKVKSLEQSPERPDLIVIDAPAAGHAVSFLLSPKGLLDAVKLGPIRKQATDVVALLSDPSRCQVLLVTIPEETPVNEVVDTAFALEDQVGVMLGPVVVNGLYPDISVTGPVTAEGIQGDASLLDVFVSEREAHDLARAAAFRSERHTIQEEQAARLAERLPLPQLRLPFVFTADLGRPEVGVLADALVEGVERLAAPA